jgi:hypothetical protein
MQEFFEGTFHEETRYKKASREANIARKKVTFNVESSSLRVAFFSATCQAGLRTN